MRVIAYRRVSTAEQADSGLGLEAQEAALSSEIERRGWQAVWLTDTASGGSLRRPALEEALRMLEAGEADGLLATKADRVARSVLDYALLQERARQERWALVLLDRAGVDTSTPQGALLGNLLSAFAEFERLLIAQRTSDALQAAKARGQRLGRPVRLPQGVRERIRAERSAGRSLAAIAGDLTAEGVPTAQGGARWHASTVAAVLRSLERDGEAAAAAGSR